jgi:hypothetical protein
VSQLTGFPIGYEFAFIGDRCELKQRQVVRDIQWPLGMPYPLRIEANALAPDRHAE